MAWFDRTVNSIEIVLGDGEIATASETDKPDLFWVAASSCVTLGIVTLLELELIPAKSYVALTYMRISSVEQATETFEGGIQDQDADHTDDILFARDRGVVCLGRLVSIVPEHAHVQQFSRAWDDWFYINAEEMSSNNDTWNEYVPIRDYLFRCGRGAFWISKYTFRYFAVPLTRLTRWALDKYIHTRVMYDALHHSGLSNQYIIQDLAVPFENCTDMVSYLDTNFKQYPLWICPLRLRGKSPNSAYGLTAGKSFTPPVKSEMLLNFGVWGPGPSGNDTFIEWNKDFQTKIKELEGEKWLYGHDYYTEKEFWQIYDLTKHDAMRHKYHAEHLPCLYEKVNCKEASKPEGKPTVEIWWIWLLALFWRICPLAGLYGWMQCISTDEYLLPRKKLWEQYRRKLKA